MNAMVHRHKLAALRICAFAAVLGALTACEISYKRGASPSTMVSDEQACRAKHETTAAYQSCMKALGWFISTADPTPGLAALTSKDDEDISIAALKREIQGESADVNSPATENTQSAKPSKAEPQRRPSVATIEPTPITSVPQNTPSAADDSEQPIKVSSWWKFGGSPQQLASDQQKCRAAVGENESADTLLISKTMYKCMRKLGWFGI